MSILATVRASSWSEFMDCSARWYYRNVEGLHAPATGEQILGTALHAGTAVYDRGRMVDDGSTVGDAVAATVAAIMHPAEETVFYGDELSLADALNLGRGLTHKYVEEIAPFHIYEGIEVACTALDVDTDAGTVRLTGTTDRIRRVHNARGIVDFKSGRAAVNPNGIANTKGHGFQLGIYQLMTEAATGEAMTLPAEIVGMHTKPRAMRVGVGEIANAKRALVGDATTPGVIELVARMLKAGVFPPNPKSILCSARYCPGYHKCSYHE